MCIRDRTCPPGSSRASPSSTCSTRHVSPAGPARPVSYTHLRAHETPEHLVCRLLLEKKKIQIKTKKKKTYIIFILFLFMFLFFFFFFFNDTATTEIYTRKIVGSVRCV